MWSEKETKYNSHLDTFCKHISWYAYVIIQDKILDSTYIQHILIFETKLYSKEKCICDYYYYQYSKYSYYYYNNSKF